MQRVQDNDFPSPGDHIHARRLYDNNEISYQEYKEVWDFYLFIYEYSRINKFNRIGNYLHDKFNRTPSTKEILNYYSIYVD